MSFADRIQELLERLEEKRGSSKEREMKALQARRGNLFSTMQSLKRGRKTFGTQQALNKVKRDISAVQTRMSALGEEKSPGPKLSKVPKAKTKKWIQKAIKHPGALRQYFGLGPEEKITPLMLNQEIKRAEKALRSGKSKESPTDLRTLLKRLYMARTMMGFKRRGKKTAAE